jgi:hypothetical protein
VHTPVLLLNMRQTTCSAEHSCSGAAAPWGRSFRTFQLSIKTVEVGVWNERSVSSLALIVGAAKKVTNQQKTLAAVKN